MAEHIDDSDGQETIKYFKGFGIFCKLIKDEITNEYVVIAQDLYDDDTPSEWSFKEFSSAESVFDKVTRDAIETETQTLYIEDPEF
jgi:hypothetical protein